MSRYTSESWPAERFYWAVVDANGWTTSGPLPKGCIGALADEVPIPADELHAVCTPTSDLRLVVCAVERPALEDLDPNLLSLTPAELPDAVGGLVEPSALELLVGEFEPRPLRRARSRNLGLILLTLAVCGALVSFGLSRRAESWRQLSGQRSTATMTLAASVIPGGNPDQLALEANRIRGRKPPPELRPAPDASLALAGLLQVWPTEIGNRPQGITVSPGSISCSVLVEGDPSPFLQSLRAPKGWKLQEPRLNTTGSATRLTLQFNPEGGER
jgi:hypothetical protein